MIKNRGGVSLFTFTNFFAASTIEEAYNELIKNRRNVILGGTSYLRMGNTNYNTAIDISNVTDIDLSLIHI